MPSFNLAESMWLYTQILNLPDIKLTRCRTYQKDDFSTTVLYFSVTCGEVRLGDVRPSLAHQMYCVDIHILRSAPTWLTIWCAVRAIYTECWGIIPQYTVSLRLCSVAHRVLIASSAISATSSYPEKEWAEPFLGCHYVSFLTRSLGFLELFSNSPWSIFVCHSWGPASRLAITKTIWSERA